MNNLLRYTTTHLAVASLLYLQLFSAFANTTNTSNTTQAASPVTIKKKIDPEKKPKTEAERIAQKKIRMEKTTAENEEAMRLFYEAVKAMKLGDLEASTADVERLTGILGGSSNVLDSQTNTSVIPKNKATDGANTNYNMDQETRKKMYKKCVDDGNAAIAKAQSGGGYGDLTKVGINVSRYMNNGHNGSGNINWSRMKYDRERACHKKWIMTAFQKAPVVEGYFHNEGKVAEKAVGVGDGLRATVYTNSDNLYTAKEYMVDLTNEKAKNAIALAILAKKKALKVLVMSKNDNFEVTDKAGKRKVEQQELQKLYEVSGVKAVCESLSDGTGYKNNCLNSGDVSTAKSSDLLSIATASCSDFDCSNIGDTFSISYHLFIAASAIYLAEQIRIKNDYNKNSDDIEESNPDEQQLYDQQTIHVMIADGIVAEGDLFAKRLLTAKANVKEMYFWVDRFARWELRSMKARIAAAEAQKQAMARAKASTKAKVSFAKKMVEILQMIVAIYAAIVAICCAMTPPACCPSNVATKMMYAGLLMLALMFLKMAMGEDDDAANRQVIAQTEYDKSLLHTKLKCNAPKYLKDTTIIFSTSIFNNIIKKGKSVVVTILNILFPNAKAESNTASSALGIKKDTGVHDYFIETKRVHSKMMSGWSNEHEQMGYGDPEKRVNYTRLLTGLGDIVYEDMATTVKKSTTAHSGAYTEIRLKMQDKLKSKKVVNASGATTGSASERQGEYVPIAEGEVMGLGGAGGSASLSSLKTKTSKVKMNSNLKKRTLNPDAATAGSNARRLKELREKSVKDANKYRRKVLGKNASLVTDASKTDKNSINDTLKGAKLIALGNLSKNDPSLKNKYSDLANSLDDKKDKRGVDYQKGKQHYGSDASKVNYASTSNGGSGNYLGGNRGDKNLVDPNAEGLGADSIAYKAIGNPDVDLDILDQTRNKYNANENDTLWLKITKTYIRVGYDILLQKKAAH